MTTAGATIDVPQLERLAQLAATIAREDPDGANTDLRRTFDDFAHVVTLVTLSDGRVVDVWPLLIGQQYRRDATMRLIGLAEDLEQLVRSWPGLLEASAGAVPWAIRDLVDRSLLAPGTGLRHVRHPSWLADLAGADIRRLLEAALAPVLAAMRPVTTSPDSPPTDPTTRRSRRAAR